MTEYAGLCIDGPLAGQVIAQDKQRFEVNVMDETVTRSTYIWHHTGAVGLWIHQPLNLHQAISLMAEAYMEKHNAAR